MNWNQVIKFILLVYCTTIIALMAIIGIKNLFSAVVFCMALAVLIMLSIDGMLKEPK